MAGIAALLIFGEAGGPALANPEGAAVIDGQVTITQSGNRLVIEQATDRAIVNWDRFGIDAGETTSIRQPAASSVSLNRVVGPEPSTLRGRLESNGNVWLVNRNGVLIGPGATVDVHGLIATTADIEDRAFMAGRNEFSIPSPDPDAAVVNQGTITVGERGLAALVGSGSRNSGVIRGRMSQVVLAGAPTFTIDFTGDGLIRFQATSDVIRAPAGAGELVRNDGTIDARGGTVLLTASAAAGVIDTVINMDGVIQSRAAEQRGGTIVLSGGAEGAVTVAGTLDASGRGTGETGGRVEAQGDRVTLAAGARIDVSGDAGGGEALIGGSGASRNAARTTVAPTATIAADALSIGNGGQAIFWSEDATRFDGTVTARGGARSGDGGFVETSGRGALAIGTTARVDSGAAAGLSGVWLLDPANVTILPAGSPQPAAPSGAAVVDAEALQASLALGDVTVQAEGAITQTPGASIAWTGNATLGFQAGGAIDINAAIANSGAGSFAAIGNTIALNDGAFIDVGDTIWLEAGASVTESAAATTGLRAPRLGVLAGTAILDNINNDIGTLAALATAGTFVYGQIGLPAFGPLIGVERPGGAVRLSDVLRVGPYTRFAASDPSTDPADSRPLGTGSSAGGTYSVPFDDPDTAGVIFRATEYAGGNAGITADSSEYLIATLRYFSPNAPDGVAVLPNQPNAGVAIEAVGQGLYQGSDGFGVLGQTGATRGSFNELGFDIAKDRSEELRFGFDPDLGVNRLQVRFSQFFASEGPSRPAGVPRGEQGEWAPVIRVTGQQPNFIDHPVRELTVSIADLGRTYGDPAPLTLPAPVIGGMLLLGDAVADFGSATASTVATPLSPAGTYEIAISRTLSAPANYNGAPRYGLIYRDGIVTIGRAPLIVAADDAGRLYGDPNPVLTATVTGLRNGDSPEAVSGLILSTPVDQASPVGTYPIAVGGGSAANYDITDRIAGRLTVAPAPLIVSANDTVAPSGRIDRLTATIGGLRNGDMSDVVSGLSFSIVGRADGRIVEQIGSGQITYPVLPVGGSAANYVIAVRQAGRVTVIPNRRPVDPQAIRAPALPPSLAPIGLDEILAPPDVDGDAGAEGASSNSGNEELW